MVLMGVGSLFVPDIMHIEDKAPLAGAVAEPQVSAERRAGPVPAATP